jgi:hypothetical protein
MLKGFVKLAGKTTTAELAHKSGLLAKEVCGAAQAACFLQQANAAHTGLVHVLKSQLGSQLGINPTEVVRLMTYSLKRCIYESCLIIYQ